MKQRFICALCCIPILCFSEVNLDSKIGYITYSGLNIGDYIQEIAVKQFLPMDSLGIDREFIGVYENATTIETLVNGWFMQTAIQWDRDDEIPEVSWPPSNSINPFFISIHFTLDFFSKVFTDESIMYLKKHAPIGARDLHTLSALQEHDIPSYFSGCMTLTLENNHKERNNIIYAVDIDSECVDYIRSKTDYIVIETSHTLPDCFKSQKNEIEKYTMEVLEKYKQAHCVITSRLHAAMPCLAYKTPVLLINSSPDQYRYDGLRELVHNCSKKQLLEGSVDFDFNTPMQNPDDYLELRKNLVSQVRAWVDKHCNDFK